MHFSLVLGDYLLSLLSLRSQDRRPKFSCLPPDSLLLIAMCSGSSQNQQPLQDDSETLTYVRSQASGPRQSEP